MADIQQLANGFVGITGDDGRTFQMPEEVAYQAFPELAPPMAPAMAPPVPMAAPTMEEAAELEQPPQVVEEPTYGTAPGGAPNVAPPQPEAPPVRAGESHSSSYSFKGVPPGRVGPSHFQKLDPSGIQAGYDAIAEGFGNAVARKGNAIERQGVIKGQMADVEQGYASDIADRQAFEASRMAQANDYITKQLSSEEQRIEAARLAVPELRPHRIFQNMGNFDKAMFTFAAAIAGGLAVKNGGRNAVIDTAMQLVDQDMQAQKVNIETAREDVYRAERAYDRMGQRLQADENAKREMSIYKIEALKTALTAEKMKFASVLTQAEHDAVIADLDIKQQEIFKGLMDSKANELRAAIQLNNDAEFRKQSIAIQREQVAISRAEANARRAEAEAKRKAEVNKQPLSLGKSTGYHHADGRLVTFNSGHDTVDKEDREKLQAAGLAATKVATSIQRLRKMDWSRFQALQPDERAAIISESMAATIGYGQISGEKIGRGMTDRDFERFQQSITGVDPNSPVRLASEEAAFKRLKLAYDDLGEAQTRLGQSLGEGYQDVTWDYPPEAKDEDTNKQTSYIEAGEKLSRYAPRDAATGPSTHEEALAAANTVIESVRSGKLDVDTAIGLMRSASRAMTELPDSGYYQIPGTNEMRSYAALKGELAAMTALLPKMAAEQAAEKQRNRDGSKLKQAVPKTYTGY